MRGRIVSSVEVIFFVVMKLVGGICWCMVVISFMIFIFMRRMVGCVIVFIM